MRMRAPVSTAVAIAVGIIVLLGYFIRIPLLENVSALLTGWAVTLLGIAGLVGVFNLVGVHWRKLRAKQDRDFYSIFFIFAFVITFAAGLWLTPSDPNFQQVVISIQVPVEVSLMAVLAVSLAYTSLRLMQKRTGVMPVVFLLSTLIFLIILSGFVPLSSNIPLLNDVLGFINKLPLAGARGILLGIALGSLTTGLRILMGADRPYSG